MRFDLEVTNSDATAWSSGTQTRSVLLLVTEGDAVAVTEHRHMDPVIIDDLVVECSDCLRVLRQRQSQLQSVNHDCYA